MEHSIGLADASILVAYLVAVVALGLWLGRRQHTLTDYLLGSRDLPWWAILGSIVSTETSTATFLSIPGLAYDPNGGDLRFLQLALGFVIGRVLVAYFMLPHYFRGALFTAYEVLDRRFGGATKTTASALFLVTRNLGDGLRLYLTAILLQQVIGQSLSVCIIIMGSAIIAYTLFGGMKSVIWNDCLQLVVYLIGAFIAAAVILQHLPGGMGQILSFAEKHDKLRVFDFSFSFTAKFTFLSGLLGGMFLTMGSHGADQMMVQRYLSARSERDARRALILSGIVVFLQFALFLALGLGLAAFYSEHPPREAFSKPDQAFATFIVHYLPVGALGITLAAVFAAALSTSLNSSAAAAVNDFYLAWTKSRPNDAKLLWLSRVLTIVFGVVQIGVGIAGQSFSETVVNEVLAIASFATGILLGVFFLGIFTQHVTQPAALFGLIVGLICMLAIKFQTELAYTYFAVLGASITFALGLWFQWLMDLAKNDRDRAASVAAD